MTPCLRVEHPNHGLSRSPLLPTVNDACWSTSAFWGHDAAAGVIERLIMPLVTTCQGGWPERKACLKIPGDSLHQHGGAERTTPQSRRGSDLGLHVGLREMVAWSRRHRRGARQRPASPPWTRGFVLPRPLRLLESLRQDFAPDGSPQRPSPKSRKGGPPK